MLSSVFVISPHFCRDGIFRPPSTLWSPHRISKWSHTFTSMANPSNSIQRMYWDQATYFISSEWDSSIFSSHFQLNNIRMTRTNFASYCNPPVLYLHGSQIYFFLLCLCVVDFFQFHFSPICVRIFSGAPKADRVQSFDAAFNVEVVATKYIFPLP